MPVYLVDLSLRSPGHDYAPLWQALTEAHAHRFMDTSWLVDVNQNVGDVTRAVLAHLPKGDSLFVLEFTPQSAWSATGLEDEANRWLAQHLSVLKIKPSPPAPPLHDEDS